MKQQPIINLSSPTIRWAQQRADKSGESLYLIQNEIGGLDIVPIDHNRLSVDGYILQPFAIVHPYQANQHSAGEIV